VEKRLPPGRENLYHLLPEVPNPKAKPVALGHLIVKVYILGLYPSCRSSWEGQFILDFSPEVGGSLFLTETQRCVRRGNLCTYTWMSRHWAATKDDKRSLPASLIQSASVSGDLKRLNKDGAFLFLNSAW